MPAVRFGVSTNFAIAKFLASRSFGNVSVVLASVRFPRGSSNETYHVPRDLLAVRPSRGLCRRFTVMARLAKRNGPIAGFCTGAVFFLDAIGRLWHPLRRY